MHGGKTADRTWMRFGMVGRMGLEMRQVVEFGVGPWEGVISGANVCRPIVTSRYLRRSAACSKITLGSLVLLRLLK